MILAIYDDLADSRRGVIALSTIAGVTGAGVIASAERQRRERELADFKAIADATQQIEVLNCGHPLPLLVHAGEVTAAAPAEAGLPLGLASPTLEARAVSVIPLRHGDRLLFYTDGITEARDRQGPSILWKDRALLSGCPTWAPRSTCSLKTSCATSVTHYRMTPRCC